MKTIHKSIKDIERNWYIVDAGDLVLGRLATRIATVLRGKHKAIFSPHLDTGDFVIVINAEKIKLTGKKESLKRYFRHTGYPGGSKFQTVSEVREKHPDRIISHAVKGMLPNGPLGRRQFKKLKVYAGSEHPHVAQQPKPLPL